MKHLMKHLNKLTATAAVALVAVLSFAPSHAMPSKRAICDSNNAHCAHDAANVDVWLFTLLTPDPKPVAKPAVAQVQVASAQGMLKGFKTTKDTGADTGDSVGDSVGQFQLASVQAALKGFGSWANLCLSKKYKLWVPCSWLASAEDVGKPAGQGGYSLSYDGAAYASAYTHVGDSATVAVLRDAIFQQGEAK